MTHVTQERTFTLPTTDGVPSCHLTPTARR